MASWYCVLLFPWGPVPSSVHLALEGSPYPECRGANALPPTKMLSWLTSTSRSCLGASAGARRKKVLLL